MALGKKVKLRRDELKIGQAQLGELCGVSRRTIVSYEKLIKVFQERNPLENWLKHWA